MRDFRKLNVWKRSHGLVLSVYEHTSDFPKSEIYGLTSQMRRAAMSVPNNISEGCGRSSIADFARFLDMAMGSASELEYQLLLARDLGFMAEAVHGPLTDEVCQIKSMLAGLAKRLRERPDK